MTDDLCTHPVALEPDEIVDDDVRPCGQPGTHDHPDPEIDMRLCDLHALMYARRLDEAFDAMLAEAEITD